MRVFVAGATGVAGIRAVARLVAAGHQVTAISRSPEKDAALLPLGAQPVRVSLFDADALRAAVAGHDGVVNLATKIPPMKQMARMSSWGENERIRTEGSRNLADAAIAAHVQVFVQESLAFLYGGHGDELIDAATADWASSPFGSAMAAAEENAARINDAGGRAVILRFGRFYAADSSHTQSAVALARRGLLADLGPGDSYMPQIDADDVASAVVAALDAPAGTYDIVDDEPLTRAAQAQVMAAAVGRRRLWKPPLFLTPKRAEYLSVSQRVSNRRFKAATNWQPLSPSVRTGYPKVVSQMHVEPALTGWTRLMLWILAFSALGVGVQATFFPRYFYDDFPFGRGWVAMDGRYNEHLIRDVGALNLALLVVTVAALLVSTRVLANTAAVAWLAYAVPHFVYHLRHLSMPMSGGEKVALVGSLAVTVIAPLVILLDRRRPPVQVVDLRDEAASSHLTPVSARS